MSSVSSAKETLDKAVQSAGYMFCNTRNLLLLASYTYGVRTAADESEEFVLQLELLETIARTSLSAIRDLKIVREGGVVGEEDEVSYGGMLAKKRDMSSSASESSLGACSKRKVDSDNLSHSSIDHSSRGKRRQTLGSLSESDLGKKNGKREEGTKDEEVPVNVRASGTLESEGQATGDTRKPGVDTVVEVHEERLARISGLVSEGSKRTAKVLWVSLFKNRFAEHELEEDYAFSRLLFGYEAPGRGEIEDSFGDFIEDKGTFREQVDWDREIDVLELDVRIERREELVDHVRGTRATRNLVDNILHTILHLKLAMDWNRKTTEWKATYTDARFAGMYIDEIEKMKIGRSAKDYNTWYSEERRKFSDRLQKSVMSRNWTLVLYKEASLIIVRTAYGWLTY